MMVANPSPLSYTTLAMGKQRNDQRAVLEAL